MVLAFETVGRWAKTLGSMARDASSYLAWRGREGFLSEQYCVSKTLLWPRLNDLGTSQLRCCLELMSKGEAEWPI